VHALVVHFAVVILPLAATALIGLIYIPKIKNKYAFITVVGVVLGSAADLVAKQSGEALSEHIGLPAEHADYGTYLTISAFLLMALSLIWYRSSRGRRSRVVTPLGHVTVLAAIAVLGLTFLTGHTGAQAVWEGKLRTTAAAPAPTSSTSKVAGTYTSADLAKHASKNSCWSAVGGSVYDLTQWIAKHPGGQGVIEGMCGRDATSAFNGQHAGASKPANFLAQYKIGKFA
jgi:uncharacterized membrane protein